MRWNLARHDAVRDREPTWADRLEPVGTFLDRHGEAVRDVAVVAQGDQIIVSALMFRAGVHHSGWVPVTFGVTRDAVVPIETLIASG